MRIALLLTLYFENGFDPLVRGRIGDCFEYFRSLCGARLRWVKLPDAVQWRKIDPVAFERFHEWLRTGVPKFDWATSWRSSDKYTASEFQFNVLGDEGPPPKLSFLQIVLPLDWLNTPQGSFPQICLRLCEILKPYHGYGGLGFAEARDVGARDQAQPLIYSFARRFPGLEVDRPVFHIFYVRDGIKGVNWLTILSAHWVEAMGGLATLRTSLNESFVFHEYDQGVLIQAGPKPELGDRNQRLWPRLYPQLARVLKPIRITKHGSFDNRGNDRFTKETSQEWLARFDSDPF